jgi:hypothetical protein
MYEHINDILVYTAHLRKYFSIQFTVTQWKSAKTYTLAMPFFESYKNNLFIRLGEE